MFRYIGNKTKLLPDILERTQQIVGNQGTVVDLMAGTGTVALAYRKHGYQVIAADMMTYSKYHLMTQLLLNKGPDFQELDEVALSKENAYSDVLAYLNTLPSEAGYFFKEFSPEGAPQNGGEPRKYFTADNAAKIDAIRTKILKWVQSKKITELEEALLKHTLIMAVNRVANISGTYGYFLSTFKKNAQEDILLAPVSFETDSNTNHVVLQGFAEDLAGQIKADLCYIDPPYMKRQYAANYHVLETIARGDYPEAIGKSGLRDWWDQHSKFCTKTRSIAAFERVVSEMDCPHFLISYSEDGLLTVDQMIDTFEKFGDVTVESIDYKRFRSNQSPLPTRIKEYIISIHK